MDGAWGWYAKWNNWGSKGLYKDFPGGPVVENSPSNAGVVGSIPGQGIKIPYALGSNLPLNIKQKQYCTKFNKGFLNDPG